MYRPLLVISIVLFLSGASVCVGQTRKPDSSEVLKALLAFPAPTPRVSPEPPEQELKQLQPNFFNRNNPPPDDAPIEKVLAYWLRWSNRWYENGTSAPKPSQTVTQRIVDYIFDKPERIAMYPNMVPATDANITKIKELYDKDQNEQQFDFSWRERVKDWLLYNSTHFLSELTAMARKVKDSPKGGPVTKADALIALAKVDWGNAEPLLRSLLASAQPRSSALALSLLYAHAVEQKDADAEENYRRHLLQIAADRNQPGYARDTAIQMLSSNEWSGRDEWYLSQFQDDSVVKLSDSDNTYRPLNRLFTSDPDKWIPLIAPLMESKDVAVRSAAASCLMVFEGPDTRSDALLPVLPWLSNPAWLNETAGDRTRLIQTVAFIDIPESVPGLLWIVENEKQEGNYNRSYAAYALGKYKDPRTAPALKRALANEKDENNRYRIIQGLVASHGLDDTEAVQALEAYLATVKTPEGLAQINQLSSNTRLELPVSIGKYLSQTTEVPESVAKAVIARAESLKTTDRTLARELLSIAHRWQGPEVDLDMINRIANGSADVNMIATALTRRKTMIEKLRPELTGLAAGNDIAPGVGAVLLDDSMLAQSVLTSGDQPAQTALLACSRLTQTPLPIELVGSFLRSKNSLLAKAAELYLLADDSHEARELLWQHHPNEAFVTGWREAIPSLYEGTLDAMSKMEEKLRAELLKEGGPVEILALLGGKEPQSSVLRIYPDRAVYSEYEDLARYRERTVSKAEVSTFKDFLTTSNFLDRGPNVTWCHDACTSQQMLVISKEKGRRVFSQPGFWDAGPFPGNFTQFGYSAKTHYNLEKEIKGLEVLFADDDLTAIDVWQHENGQLRVLVERPEDEDVEQPVVPENDDEDEVEEDEAALIESRRRELANDLARYSWRVFANGELGEVTSRPDVYSVVDPVKFMAYEDDNEETFEYAQQMSANSIIVARFENGLWKETAGAKPVRLGTETGAYGNPIVTPDHKWVVAGKTDNDWSEPNYVVRVNLKTGREFRVKLEPADEFVPLTFLPGVDKVLLRRNRGDDTAKPVGPERPEFYLLDAATGETRLVSGNFEPLLEYGNRFLQRTDKPEEYWAAIPDNEKNETQVGRYNVRDFSFKPVMTVPHIVFESMGMWVDGNKGKLYVVYEGQLLSLPLPAAAANNATVSPGVRRVTKK